MDPFKTGPTRLYATALNLEGFTWCGTKTGRNNIIANLPVSFDSKSQFTTTSFSSVTGWTETA